MYRQSADPNVRIEIYSLGVSTRKGGELVGILGGVSLIFGVVLAISVLKEPPPDVAPMQFDLGMLAGVVVFLVAALLRQRKRKRRLTIEQHGEALSLTVTGADVTLDFPLAIHGTQYKEPTGGVVARTAVLLQLVDRKNHGIALHHSRAVAYGEQPDWDLPNTRRDLERVVMFDVGMNDLAEVRAKVHALNEKVKPA